ncbi:MAG: hypothetical protein R3B47_11770 [Bacteroidia bacterium]
MRKTTTILLFICISGMLAAQQGPNIWLTLGKTKLTKQLDEDLGIAVSVPEYPGEVEALDGNIVEIKGYIIPMEADLGYFAFSAFPYEACFFCGQAGIETVMEVKAKEAIRYTAKRVTLRGKLLLNRKEFSSRLLFLLEDAELIEN